MFYDAVENVHGLRHDPFKALVSPRPIGWVSTLSRAGVANLAPYSFFAAVSEKPAYVIFSASGSKDTRRNVEDTGEFVCSIASYDLREQMNKTSARLPADCSEFEHAGLERAPSRMVAPPRVAASPAALECRYWKTIELPVASAQAKPHAVIFGLVVGIYIDDRVIEDGMVLTDRIRPLARLGYRDYAFVSAETMFSLPPPRD
ncbi:MAG: flavin reductase family protein [Beijerinckiaceae bacterium]|jgi:flavin reductase (DIM6/NTAB) family NADH-FMN oxidoreductase RutF|nr:flavin reductase family protein [Beijerinckiaceae bacterium]MDO9442383.1 flavin reductase family protein [Beijerinckiaceae bacterium]